MIRTVGRKSAKSLDTQHSGLLRTSLTTCVVSHGGWETVFRCGMGAPVNLRKSCWKAAANSLAPAGGWRCYVLIPARSSRRLRRVASRLKSSRSPTCRVTGRSITSPSIEKYQLAVGHPLRGVPAQQDPVSLARRAPETSAGRAPPTMESLVCCTGLLRTAFRLIPARVLRKWLPTGGKA